MVNGSFPGSILSKIPTKTGVRALFRQPQRKLAHEPGVVALGQPIGFAGNRAEHVGHRAAAT